MLIKRNVYFVLALVLIALVGSLALLIPDSSSMPPVILITADTLRADHLGCYGYFRNTSPTIDKLAKQGLLFERTISTAAVTLPSHVSIMTSTYPSRHGILSNLRFFNQPVKAEASLEFAAQIFKRAGYLTAAFTSASPLRGITGISYGFDEFSGVGPWEKGKGEAERSAAGTISQALGWLDNVEGPYFLWIHLFDPHASYKPPSPYDQAFKAGPELRQRLELHAVPEKKKRKAEIANDRYDGEILYLDSQLKRLFDALKKRGEYERAFIVFTTDHGEGLYQHGRLGHEVIWNEQILLALIFKFPKGHPAPQGRRSDLASSIDILPTLISATGVPANTSSLDGIDLLDKTRHSAMSERWNKKTSVESYALSTEDWKMILDENNEDKLFDLQSDPHETDNVIDTHAKRAAGMREELLALLRANRKKSSLQKDTEVTPEIREEQRRQLEALGYIE